MWWHRTALWTTFVRVALPTYSAAVPYGDVHAPHMDCTAPATKRMGSNTRICRASPPRLPDGCSPGHAEHYPPTSTFTPPLLPTTACPTHTHHPPLATPLLAPPRAHLPTHYLPPAPTPTPPLPHTFAPHLLPAPTLHPSRPAPTGALRLLRCLIARITLPPPPLTPPPLPRFPRPRASHLRTGPTP